MTGEQLSTESLPLAAREAYEGSLFEDLVQIIISQQVAIESQGVRLQEANYRADHDELTGLLRRNVWMQHVDGRVAEAERTGQPFGILFIDLTNFKGANDDCGGHEVGDRFLCGAAKAVHEVLRSSREDRNPDLVSHQRLVNSDDEEGSRYGGDEFGVLCELSTDADPAAQLDVIARSITDRYEGFVDGYLVQNSPELQPHGYRFTLAIGRQIWEAGMTADKLIKLADADMFKRKSKQYEQVGRFQPVM